MAVCSRLKKVECWKGVAQRFKYCNNLSLMKFGPWFEIQVLKYTHNLWRLFKFSSCSDVFFVLILLKMTIILYFQTDKEAKSKTYVEAIIRFICCGKALEVSWTKPRIPLTSDSNTPPLIKRNSYIVEGFIYLQSLILTSGGRQNGSICTYLKDL